MALVVGEVLVRFRTSASNVVEVQFKNGKLLRQLPPEQTSSRFAPSIWRQYHREQPFGRLHASHESTGVAGGLAGQWTAADRGFSCLQSVTHSKKFAPMLLFGGIGAFVSRCIFRQRP